MHRMVIGTILASMGLFAAGCTSGASVAKGDRFEVVEEIRETATTQWEQPYSDGFTAIIPKGTVLEAVFATTPGAEYFESTPVRVNGQTEAAYVLQFFVPEGIRTRAGFEGFTFSLPTSYIGTKLKKLEN